MRRSGRIILVLVLAAALTLTACQGGSSFQPDESSIYLKRDGTVEAAVIEPFDENTYDLQELRSYIEGIVSEYNQDKIGRSRAYADEQEGVLPVAITSLDVSGGNAKLYEVYENCESYVDFNRSEGAVSMLSTGPLAAARSNGINPEDYQLRDAKSGDAMGAEHLDESKSMVVLIQGTVNLQVEGRIKAMSEGLSLTNKSTVYINSPDTAVCVIYQ